MKKVKFLVSVVLVCCLLGSVSSALAAQVPETPSLEPQYTGITSMNTPFSISGSGLATCVGTISIDSGYSVSATLELQQEVSAGVWETIKTWDQSSSTFISISKSRYVLPGYDYQLKLTAKVYNSRDILVETPYKYSVVIHYP